MDRSKKASSPKDFYQRTLEIINEYKGNYDVTLLLNCCMGLIVLPRENGELNNDTSVPKGLEDTYKVLTGGTISFSEYIIGLRNAIVHWGQQSTLEYEHADNGEIIGIKLEGQIKNRTVTIAYQFSLLEGNELKLAIEEIGYFIYGINDGNLPR